ncbi:MAG: alpha/beta fold hydrolase [Lachnospiraceae bacterium]|nr:alpha/beta fold hydrolase [Lachnospiraceae bacterium]
MQIKNITIAHHNRAIDATCYKPEGKNCLPLVIFSHGYNGHGEDFAVSAEYFAANGIGAVCFNFCGGSTRDVSGFPTTEMTLFTEKEDLIAVIDEIKKWEWVDNSQIYLFGSSQGGMVSALTAEERQEDVRALILLYPALCIADDWNARFKNAEDIPDSEELWGMVLGRRFFETIREFRIKEQIGQYSGRVLLMHGTEDNVVSLEYSVWASEKYPNARLEIFPGEGHGFSEAGDRRMEAMALYFIHECMKRRLSDNEEDRTVCTLAVRQQHSVL